MGRPVSILSPEVLPLVEHTPLAKMLAMVDPALTDRVLENLGR